jgi:hypothetical protein
MYRQTGPEGLREGFLPNLASVGIQVGDGYRVPNPPQGALSDGQNPAYDPPTINRGSAQEIEFFFISFGGETLSAGEVATFRVDLAAGERSINFDVNSTFYAPQGANDALRLENLDP